jgi:hypothetical protein
MNEIENEVRVVESGVKCEVGIGTMLNDPIIYQPTDIIVLASEPLI